MSADVQVKVNASEVREALDGLDDKAANAAIGRAAKKGATFLAQRARPEAPVGKQPKPANKRLKRTISARTAKRDKPGAVVVVRAPHRHLVMRGTAQRFTASGARRGVMPANPFIDRTADSYGAAALDRAIDEIAHQIGLD